MLVDWLNIVSIFPLGHFVGRTRWMVFRLLPVQTCKKYKLECVVVEAKTL